jgi:hypothetical protein
MKNKSLKASLIKKNLLNLKYSFELPNGVNSGVWTEQQPQVPQSFMIKKKKSKRNLFSNTILLMELKHI